MQKIVTLLTDFGTKDTYVPQMKGVLLSLNPALKIVDISHQVAPQNIMEGAFLLKTTYSYFPPGTIHVAVVDPGVGTSRKALLVETEKYFFIGPDNGILSPTLHKETIKNIIEIKNSEYFLKNVSITFHGRDIFATVAAHLASGIKPQQFGPTCDSYVQLKFPPLLKSSPTKGEESIEACVIYTDNFGNLITNVQKNDLDLKRKYEITIDGKKIQGLSKTYFDKNKGEIVALIGSSGFLEIAIVEGSAHTQLSPTSKILISPIPAPLSL
ncbi:MAG TPA: SAM-dependent chlorinase/fluorinase [Bdellovibrionota bacterium]|nr:SAM-dependent chlorinase/fluorinase [Bdellovibrionota bacterium]